MSAAMTTLLVLALEPFVQVVEQGCSAENLKDRTTKDLEEVSLRAHEFATAISERDPIMAIVYRMATVTARVDMEIKKRADAGPAPSQDANARAATPAAPTPAPTQQPTAAQATPGSTAPSNAHLVGHAAELVGLRALVQQNLKVLRSIYTVGLRPIRELTALSSQQIDAGETAFNNLHWATVNSDQSRLPDPVTDKPAEPHVTRYPHPADHVCTYEQAIIGLNWHIEKRKARAEISPSVREMEDWQHCLQGLASMHQDRYKRWGEKRKQDAIDAACLAIRQKVEQVWSKLTSALCDMEGKVHRTVHNHDLIEVYLQDLRDIVFNKS